MNQFLQLRMCHDRFKSSINHICADASVVHVYYLSLIVPCAQYALKSYMYMCDWLHLCVYMYKSHKILAVWHLADPKMSRKVVMLLSFHT